MIKMTANEILISKKQQLDIYKKNIESGKWDANSVHGLMSMLHEEIDFWREVVKRGAK